MPCRHDIPIGDVLYILQTYKSNIYLHAVVRVHVENRHSYGYTNFNKSTRRYPVRREQELHQ